MKTTSYSIDDLEYDAHADRARSRTRVAAAALMSDMEEAARKSKRQDAAAINRINSVLTKSQPDRACRAHSHPPGHTASVSEDCTAEHDYSVGRANRHRLQLNHKRNPYMPVQEPNRATISQQRKNIESRLDHLLDFEMPSADYFNQMRGKLRNVNEKMLGHKLMLDRYSGIELTPGKSVNEGVEDKYHQLVERMPELENYKFRPQKTTDEKLYYDSPRTTAGYSGSLVPQGPEVSELRGRIRRLVCRSKNNPHYYRV